MLALWRWLGLAAALLFLNASVTFANVWPTLGVRLRPELSGELAALVFVWCLWTWRLRRRRGQRDSPAPWALRIAAGVWAALILGRYVDVTTRSLYGRDVNLYWDMRHLPAVGGMFAEVATIWLTAGFVLGALLVPAGLYGASRWALGRVNEAAGHWTSRRVLATAAGSLAVLWMVQLAPWTGHWRVPGLRFAGPVTAVYARELGELAYEMTGAGVRSLPPPRSFASDLSAIEGADVLLVFLESYGAVSFDRPELAEPLAASRAAFEAAVRETDRAVVSAFVESTTFGGESWLAHISLLSGTEVRDQSTNVRLMAQDRDTMPKLFDRHGYRTVAVMPGLLHGWPEGEFYGFEEILDFARLDYHGPPFGWWGITDQFVLARLDALEVDRARRPPLFVFFPTITTHAPFTPAPPYQPDWARILTPHPYETDELNRAWSDQPDWLNLGPSYVKGLVYAQATLSGYLRRHAGDDLVIMLIGDHQPPALVSGESASWNVPVHVITDRPALLERLRARAFRDGLAPQAPAITRIDGLLPLLLEAFGGGG